MGAFELSSIIFVCVFCGGLLGLWLRTVLPEHHLNEDTRDLIKLGVGLIGTLAALVLGLLIASAANSYDTRRAELTQMAANTILLDRMLAHYGAETAPIRAGLKVAVARNLDQIWPKTATPQDPLVPDTRREFLFDELQGLAPHTDAQRSIQSQAVTLAISLGQTRLLLFEQNGSSFSVPLMAVVVFWLTILFVSFGMFAPLNATVMVTLLVSAMSVAGAIFLILELNQPFSGLMQISDAPLRTTLAVLGK